jgi:hypothetical protein
MNLCRLVFCGSMPLEPSWYITRNLSRFIPRKPLPMNVLLDFRNYQTRSYRKKAFLQNYEFPEFAKFPACQKGRGICISEA